MCSSPWVLILPANFTTLPPALAPACVPKGGSWDAALLQPHSQASALGLGAASALRPWADLVLLLSAGLVMLQEQAVPRIIIKCLMKQVLAFIDVQVGPGTQVWTPRRVVLVQDPAWHFSMLPGHALLKGTRVCLRPA